MNRKLKKMLKKTYGAAPERKSSFLRQLSNDMIWRKLHPIRSLIKLSPSHIIISAAAVSVTIGAGIALFYLTGNDNDSFVPAESSAIIEAAETTLPETDTYTEFTTVSSGIKIGVTTGNTEKTVLTSEKYVLSVGNVKHSAVETAINTDSYTAVTTKSATAETSVYHVQFFDHIGNIDDLRKHYEDIKSNQIMYGYPDYNYFEDMLRLMCEEWEQDFDEIYKDFEGYLSNNLSYEVLNNVLSTKKPPVIEGKTDGIEYVVYEGKPWTVCDILVSEVYNYDVKHIFSKGDRIKIAMPGGYMSAKEYIELEPDNKTFSGWSDKKINETMIFDEGSNQNAPKTGDVFTYIISYDDYIPDFPVSGCFTRFSFNDMAQFTRNGDIFTNCNSNFKDMYFTLDQINDNRFEFTDILKDPDSGKSLGIKNNSLLFYGEFDCYSISEDGAIEYLGSCNTDLGFYPFHDENDYSVTWTDDGVTIEYRADNMKDVFYTKTFKTTTHN